MEKIIDVTALTGALKILLWDRSKSREELAELVIGLIEEEGEEVVRCKDCKHHRGLNEAERRYLAGGVLICTSSDVSDDCWAAVWANHFCRAGERRDSE